MEDDDNKVQIELPIVLTITQNVTQSETHNFNFNRPQKVGQKILRCKHLDGIFKEVNH